MRLWQLDNVARTAKACQVQLLVSRQWSVVRCERDLARGVGWLPLIEFLSSTEKLSHDDTTPSIYTALPNFGTGWLSARRTFTRLRTEPRPGAVKS
jgi:hypothetical protein